MTFEELITARYTQRSYDNKPVEDEKIQKILQAGRVAPTAKNNQPQKIYVLQSSESMDKLHTLTPCHYNAPLAMIICYDKNQQWHNPSDESITSGVEDASIVATHMMLQAADLGVHSTWVNMFVPNETRKAFNLPENEVPVLLMMFGYPTASSAPAPTHTNKKPLSDTVKFL